MLRAFLKFASIGALVLLVGATAFWLNNVGQPWWYVPMVAMVGSVGLLSTLLLGDREAVFRRAATAVWSFLFRNVTRAGATFAVLAMALVLTGWQGWRTWPESVSYFSVMVFREVRQPEHFAVGATVFIHTETDGATHVETVGENGRARFEGIASKTNVWLQINEKRETGVWMWAAPDFTIETLPKNKEYDLAAIPETHWKRVGPAPVPEMAAVVSSPAGSLGSLGDQIGDLALQKINAPWGTPAAPTVINRYAYILGIDTDRRIPLWAAYAVGSQFRDTGRRPQFVPDPAVPADMQSTPADYRRSGFDRGHLVSPRDVSYKGRIAVVEANYQTTLTPQTPKFNRRVWLRLERATRDLATHLGRQVFVLNGPLFMEGGPSRTIGPNEIPVPTHFFRVITWIGGEGVLESAAYLIPNDVGSTRNFQDFAVSIAEIERASRLTILPDFDPQTANAIKAKLRRLSE